MSKYLSEISIPIDSLMLDPNNPRFVKDIDKISFVPDDQITKEQETVLNRFSYKNKTDEELDVTNIKELYESMRMIGFVEIDRVVVRKIDNSDDFLVIEGNRRISTVKFLLQHFNDGTIFPPSERDHIESMLPSFNIINCLLMETSNLSKDEISHRINVILGLRHHGSLLEWEPLPSAYNIYNEYMSEDPIKPNFHFNNTKIQSVKSRLSISPAVVKKALKTYIVYLQLRERFPDVKDRHYSLIESAITNRYLHNSYFKQDDSTYLLDEASLSKMDKICQFSIRDSLPETKKKIIREPKRFRLLGSLIYKKQQAKHEATRSYIDDVIHQVEDENDLDMTLEIAVDEVTAFLNRKRWAKTISALIDKQNKQLSFDDYTGEGNDRGNKDELKNTLSPLRKIMDI